MNLIFRLQPNWLMNTIKDSGRFANYSDNSSEAKLVVIYLNYNLINSPSLE